MPSGPDVASIASVGYGLAALCIGAERGFAPAADLEARALGTLKTLFDNVQHEHGFFYHFLDIGTGKRTWQCEASVIDTAICLDGVLMAGACFGGEVETWARKIYDRVDWPWYASASDGKRFSMGYKPEEGFFGSWDMTAEQFMMYFLGAGSATHPTSGAMFYAFARPLESYAGLPNQIRSPAGSLFVYQFSHAWFDLRGTLDAQKTDWFRNSTLATLASRRYAMDLAATWRTGPLDWGFTASDGPKGYDGNYGSKPGGGFTDGTVAPYGAAGSIVFTPELSIKALANMKATLGEAGLWGKYGFKDAYNRSKTPVWINGDTIGIDKGVEMLMIENYLTGFVWETMSSIPSVQAGMIRCGIGSAGEVRVASFEESLVDEASPAFGPYEAATSCLATKATVAASRTDADRGAASLSVDAQAGGEVAFALRENALVRVKEEGLVLKLSAKGPMGAALPAVRLLDASGATLATLGTPVERDAAFEGGGKSLEYPVRDAGDAFDVAKVASVVVSFSTSGRWLLDELAFAGTGTRISGVLVDGTRKVGETATFLWSAYDPRDREVVVRHVRWLSSAGPSGPWEPIAGAVGATYPIGTGDVDRFLRVEIVCVVDPGDAEIVLEPVQSESSGKIID